jgi:hypothetical protein
LRCSPRFSRRSHNRDHLSHRTRAQLTLSGLRPAPLLHHTRALAHAEFRAGQAPTSPPYQTCSRQLAGSGASAPAAGKFAEP